MIDRTIAQPLSAPIPTGISMPQLGPGGQQLSLVSVLLRRKGIALFFALAGLGCGYIYFAHQPQTYSAHSVIEVSQGQARSSTGSVTEGVHETAPGVLFIEAEITSDAVLWAAVEMGQLTAFDDVPSDPAAVVKRLRNGLKLQPATAAATAKDRTIVRINFESGNPLFCTAAVRSILAAYDNHLNGRHRATIDAMVAFFGEARDTILPQLNSLEQQYADFRKTTPLEWSSTGEAVNPYRQEAIALEGTLLTTRSEARQIDTKLRLIEESSLEHRSALLALQELEFVFADSSSISLKEGVITSHVERDIDSKVHESLIPKLVRLDLLKGQYGKNHPLPRDLGREIEATQAELMSLNRTRQGNQPDATAHEMKREEAAGTLLRRYINSLKKKHEMVGEDILDLESRLADTRSRANDLIRFENDNASYVRRISRYQGMIDSFDTQLEKAGLPLLNPGLEVEVLRPAGDGMLTGPLLSRSLMLGGILGAMLGCLGGWLVDWSQFTYRSADEVATFLDLPILAHLPMMQAQKKSRQKKVEGDEPANPLDMIDRTISVIHDAHSSVSEAIRSIRTSLFCSLAKQIDLQTILVTSALPGDGKSTVVANLGASIAGAEKKVIIVDADMRRPTQHSLFGIKAPYGLTSVLNDECVLGDAIVSTGIDGLDVLPCGPRPNNPAEAITLPEFRQLLDMLRNEYDVILIDSPPLLACTDASIVSSQVDGVVFVMRISRNIKPMSRRAVQVLRALHVNLLGVVVNAVGDSRYSTAYAFAGQYGVGSEYSYLYGDPLSEEYLRASKSQSITIHGRGHGRLDKQFLIKPTAGSCNGRAVHNLL